MPGALTQEVTDSVFLKALRTAQAATDEATLSKRLGVSRPALKAWRKGTLPHPFIREKLLALLTSR
jgi:hypothetical protein